MLQIGCHLSSVKGFEHMGEEALSIGANTFQFFTRNPRGGKAKDIDPEELAMKLNISYSCFRKVFKDYTGYAPAKYFQELKLRKAKQLLVGTSQSVKEISFMLDYKSTEHFFSLFKKRTGFTPLEYRSFGRETEAEDEDLD